MFAVTELAEFYGRQRAVAEVLRRMRCSDGCGGRVAAAWLVTGPILNARVRPRRVAAGAGGTAIAMSADVASRPTR